MPGQRSRTINTFDIGEGVKTCAYCGENAATIDHIPPQSMRVALRETGNYTGFWGSVYSCLWCNSTLQDNRLLTITERSNYIKARLRVKFKRLLKSPEWEKASLVELGDTLRGYLAEYKEKKRILSNRLNWEAVEPHTNTQTNSTEGKLGPLYSRSEWRRLWHE